MDGLLRVHTDTRFCHNHPFRLDESQCVCYVYIHHNRKVVEIYTADIRGISRELAVTLFSRIIIRNYINVLTENESYLVVSKVAFLLTLCSFVKYYSYIQNRCYRVPKGAVAPVFL